MFFILCAYKAKNPEDRNEFYSSGLITSRLSVLYLYLLQQGNHFCWVGGFKYSVACYQHSGTCLNN